MHALHTAEHNLSHTKAQNNGNDVSRIERPDKSKFGTSTGCNHERRTHMITSIKMCENAV